MPRYISSASAYKKTARHAEKTLVSTPRGPEEKVTKRAIVAAFRLGGVTPWERDQALEKFGYVQQIESTDPDRQSYSVSRVVPGLAEGEDVTKRFSYYDTDEQARFNNWSPETKAEVEKNLDAWQNQDYFRCDKPKRPAPWPSYDKLVKQGKRTAEMVAEKIAAQAEESGYDPERIIAYETENQNRPEVIEALAKMLEEKEPEATVAA